MKTNDVTLDIPTGLNDSGLKAANIILAFMEKHNMSTGGCRLFYSPEQWKSRGEEYGITSELIFVYDGGDLFDVLNGYIEGSYRMMDEFTKVLVDGGFHYEPCTHWYSAVYAD